MTEFFRARPPAGDHIRIAFRAASSLSGAAPNETTIAARLEDDWGAPGGSSTESR